MIRSLSIALLLALALTGCASEQKRAENRNAARVNTQLGISYAERGLYDVALDKLNRAMKLDDSLAPAHVAAAFVYQKTGDARKAEKHYRRALELDNDDPVLKNNFGVFLCGQMRGLEAESYFLEAARNPRYATPDAAWTNAGLCLKAYDLDKAEKYLREALALRPESREALAQLAVISYHRGEYLSTRAFLQRYNLRTSATAELLYVAARTEEALGDAAAARQYEQRLKLEFPESAEAAASQSKK
ncbi:type IV pilus biogenesis/stability protein PilW [Fontimonas sp. SYSU GA230001]|uniref:type IV pilus biogenesis/stability protein PilW n=1 Tax=Fontimonas sp. SYSU GA230001 TaxID=3142450 RepID=UPI0032B37B9F